MFGVDRSRRSRAVAVEASLAKAAIVSEPRQKRPRSGRRHVKSSRYGAESDELANLIDDPRSPPAQCAPERGLSARTTWTRAMGLSRGPPRLGRLDCRGAAPPSAAG